MYHVGYELTNDGVVGSISVSVKESLMINFRSNQQRGGQFHFCCFTL